MKHKSKLSKSYQKQTLIQEYSSLDKDKNFKEDLCEALASANIPLSSLSNEQFRKFLEKHTNSKVPDESTIRKLYVPPLYERILDNIRKEIGENYIWVSIDETTDCEGRYIGNVVIGILNSDIISKPYLINTEQLEKVNHQTIGKLFNDSMSILWHNGIQHVKVLLVITDAAPYMLKTFECLKVIYPKMIHVTCLAHAMHRLIECIRLNYDEIDLLISTVKKIFVKSPFRVMKFKEMFPTIRLPPKPVITRWGTWIDAALYYAENLHNIKDFLLTLDSKESNCIRVANGIINSATLYGDLVFIKCNFFSYNTCFLTLQSRNLELSQAILAIKDIEKNVQLLSGADKIKSKLEYILNKNNGYKTMCLIEKMISDGCILEDLEEDLTPDEVSKFKYAPITSTEVERTFSKYKNILKDNRRSFHVENIKKFLIIQCYFD